MSIEATYISPHTGRVDLNLCDKQDNIVLHVNPRWNESALILNTCSQGCWGVEERPTGFDFSAHALVRMRVEYQEHHYTILCNGRVLHTYVHRIPASTVKKITWQTNDDDQCRLISLTVGY